MIEPTVLVSVMLMPVAYPGWSERQWSSSAAG
jgi:hypothetical protein